MEPKDRLRTRSQFPSPLEGEAQQPATGHAQDKPRPELASRVNALRVLFPVTLDPTERVFFRSTLSVSSAQRDGVSANPHDVADEYTRCVQAYAPWLTRGALCGYGSLRVSYGLGLAADMAPTLDAHSAATSSTTAATAQSAQALALTGPARRLALRSLRNLTGHDPAARARLRDALKDLSVDGRIRSLDRIRAEVQDARAHIPSRVLTDAGLTPEVLDALAATSQQAADARARVRDQKQQAQVIRADLAEPTGRLLRELRLLLAAARDTRSVDATLPTVTSWLISRGASRPEEGGGSSSGGSTPT
jgi:hypothetical protein